MGEGKKNFLRCFFAIHALTLLYCALPVSPWSENATGNEGWEEAVRLEYRLSTFREKLDSPYAPWTIYAYVAGAQQDWRTFAPFPPMRYANYRVFVDGESGRFEMWNDGLGIDRSGAGFFYDPTVKLTGWFGHPMITFQEIFLASQVHRYERRFGGKANDVSLVSHWKMLRIVEGWKVEHLGPFETEVMKRRVK